MPTPHPTWEPGRLTKSDADKALIVIPDWISDMMEGATVEFAKTCYREGYRTGYNNGSDQYSAYSPHSRADIIYSVRYMLRQAGASRDQILVVEAALRGSLPPEFQPKNYSPPSPPS